MSEPASPPRRGYPLAALFVLLAAAAVFSAIVAPVMRHMADGRLDTTQVLVSAAILGISAAVLAVIVRLFTSRRPRDQAIAAGAGGLVGAVGGAAIWIPPSEIGFVFITVSLGSAAVIIAAAFGRPRDRD